MRSSTHLAVGQPLEGSFGLGGLQELHDGGEAGGRQQDTAQGAVRREELLQLCGRHPGRKVFHQDHSCAPRSRGLDRGGRLDTMCRGRRAQLSAPHTCTATILGDKVH